MVEELYGTRSFSLINVPAGSTARLRDFINQSDAVGVADFADKCLALFDH